MGWENITVEGITTTNCNDNSFWTDYCPVNSTAKNNWRNWTTTYASSLDDSPKASYSELNTDHWIFGDASCGIECEYGTGYSGHLYFKYNNNPVLTIYIEPERIQRNNYEYFFYFGINDVTEEGSAFLIVRDPSDNTARQLNGESFGDDWKHNLYLILKAAQPTLAITSNGGGATHIAKVTGQLKDLSSNLSDILIVSGGGGGGLLVGETEYPGADAGGISGSGDNSADQSTGNAFGQGESGTSVSGGGSGLYGGYKGTSAKSGGAGSGYIGNSLLSNKKMIGYNVPTSSAESTKTESVNEASETPVSGKPKIGNGFARIKFLRDWAPPTEYQELLDLINGANFTEKYYMTDNWITKLSDSATSGATASIDNGFKSYSYARYTDTGNSNIWYTNPVAQWNNNSYSNNKYVAGTSSWEGTTEPCTCGIVAFSKLNININKVSNDSYTFSLSNLSPLAVYSFYGTKYYIFRVRYNPSDSPTGWRSFSVSYTELPPEYLGSVSYTGTLENCLKVIAMNFRNVNIYVDGILWSAAVS